LHRLVSRCRRLFPQEIIKRLASPLGDEARFRDDIPVESVRDPVPNAQGRRPWMIRWNLLGGHMFPRESEKKNFLPHTKI
jgi:hypothetical protein